LFLFWRLAGATSCPPKVGNNRNMVAEMDNGAMAAYSNVGEHPTAYNIARNSEQINQKKEGQSNPQKKRSFNFIAALCFGAALFLSLVLMCTGYFGKDHNPTRFFSVRRTPQNPTTCSDGENGDDSNPLKKRRRWIKSVNPFKRKRKASSSGVGLKIKPYVPTLPSDFEDILAELDRRVMIRPDMKERAKNIHWPLVRDNYRRWLDLSKFELVYKGIPLEQYIWNSIEWRERDNVCCIPNSQVYGYLETPKMYVQGKDRLGRPVLIIQPRFETRFDVGETILALAYSIERAIKEMPVGVEQFTAVLDFQGLGRQNIPSAGYLKAVFQTLMDNFPLHLGVVLVLHAGAPIELLWRLVAPVCTERTRRKVSFVPSDRTADVLREYVAPEELEARYGGHRAQPYDRSAYLSAHKPRKRLG